MYLKLHMDHDKIVFLQRYKFKSVRNDMFGHTIGHSQTVIYRVVKRNLQVVRFCDFEHMRARMAQFF